ncbi:MAG TPA: NTP transferase domain-containing protein, partial [Novosphingobium sp.]|nr:NTP transferase domain-containing protein [Novosphingobium sp.]
MKLAALVLAAGGALTGVYATLAAGGGSRFGGGKLEALLRGEPLVSHAIRAARAAPVDRVIVVAAPALPLPDGVETVRIATTALSDSLKAGIAAAGPVDGLFVFLGD